MEMADMRSVEELKQIKDRRPFEPFFIHLADGRELRITHPDSVAWHAGGIPRVVLVAHADGSEFLDLTLITSLRIPHSEAAKDAGS
jgi:hypothetical protein